MRKYFYISKIQLIFMFLVLLNTNLFLTCWNYLSSISTYLPIHQFVYRSVYKSVCGEYDCLSLPSFPMPKRLLVRFIHWHNINCLCHLHVYTSISFCIWLSQYLSVFLCQLYSPIFRSQSPAIHCIHRYQRNIFFSTKSVTCGQQSITRRSMAPNVSLMYSLDPASGLYPQ
jgi:hypothetical protein